MGWIKKCGKPDEQLAELLWSILQEELPLVLLLHGDRGVELQGNVVVVEYGL